MLHLLIHRFELPESEQHDHLSVNPKPSLYLRRALHFAQNLHFDLRIRAVVFLRLAMWTQDDPNFRINENEIGLHCGCETEHCSDENGDSYFSSPENSSFTFF